METYILGYTLNGKSKFTPLVEGSFIKVSEFQIDHMNDQTEGAKWKVKPAIDVYPERLINDICNQHFPGLAV